ncbi:MULTISPECIES: D-aminoacyl-tRNA deacylase [unclassified Pseudactinotalea]|uniref:D-aminoacyl-tRNA deacylase n=1 Tax=unclassified Pseudactinotalea TaxID=2649176 RepID=UPI00128DB3D4|nr:MULTISPECIES: D-aminoacyl-tRNA deacylase [unclassified Pseudactinotalea]MPV50434.1 D-tyrosyl-tRNA(Tyr) deacylase [Pseudactinotalea sp. HY160]
MRAVLQRVSSASVTVEGEVAGRIGAGLVALVAAAPTDTGADAATVARKIAELRILPGETSVADAGAEVLVVSQFTLYGDTRKGRRPSWSGAAPGELAEPLVDRVVTELRTRGITVATGIFGADMSVSLTNEGPFTVLVDT